MEKDDEMNGGGSSYSAKYWQYDAKVIRRFNLDPDQMSEMSNYSVMGNNPIIFIDPDGDKFTPVGGQNEIDMFIELINAVFEGKAQLVVQNDGSITVSGDRESLSAHQQIFYDVFKDIEESPEDVQMYFLNQDERVHAIFGGYRGYSVESGPEKGEGVNTIDMYDVIALDADGSVSREAMAMHELYETFQDQIHQGMEGDPNSFALGLQQAIDGMEIESQYRGGNRIPNSPTLFTGEGYTQFKVDGKKFTMVAQIVENDVVSTSTVEGWQSDK